MMAALPWEVRPFLRQVKARPASPGSLPAWEFPLGQGQGLVVLSGMGQAAARRAAAALLARERPAPLVSLGFGGALTPDLPPGALVLGEAFWRYHPHNGVLEAAGLPAAPRPLPELLRRLREAGLPAFTGNLVTTGRIIAKGRHREVLGRLERPLLDLETGVLAAAAAARGVAFLSLRAVTDGAGEEIPGFLRGAGDGQTAAGSREALRWLAGNPRRLQDLLRLWRRSRLAARTLALALLVLLPLILGRGQELENQPA